MSVLIKGIEMPTSCRACLYSRTDIRNVDWCVLTEKDLPCDCPLIPVPPHGRLIDADALYKDLLEDVGYGEAERFNDYWLGEQPTVIPAEPAEEASP